MDPILEPEQQQRMIDTMVEQGLITPLPIETEYRVAVTQEEAAKSCSEIPDHWI